MKKSTELLTVAKYIKMISEDYQFDKKHEEYCGFLNVDPEESGEWSDIATQISVNQKQYEKVCNEFGISIESGAWEREMVFTNELRGTVKKGENLF